MDKEILKGDWNLLKGKIKENWGKLTDDDLTAINGKKDQLLGALQKKYGYAKEKAAEEFSNWEKKSRTNQERNQNKNENDQYKHAGKH
jgi:uncharacterized protein YjbJ (UPF0337 family)